MSKIWEQVQLGKVCEIILGQSPSSDTYNQDRIGLPFFQGKSEFGNKYAQPKTWCSEPLRIASKNDILISVRAPVGESNLAPENCCIGRGLAALRADQENLLQEFLWHYIEFRKGYLQGISQGSTFDAISGTDLRELEIVLPPLPEQKKIAQILSGIDNAIAALKQSKRIRISAHEQAMAEFINDSMETTQDLEGMGYEVLDGDRGDAYPKEKDLNSNGYCLFLSAKNVTKLGFSFGSCQYISREKDSEMRKGRLERGDIVITTRGTLGNVAYFTDSIPIRAMRINSGMAIIRPKTRRNPEKGEFLHSCLLSDFVQNQIAKASFGTAQNQLTLGIIKKLRFPVLSITNETLFTKQYTALLSYDKKFREGFAKREYLRQAIASDLLSGRKRVTV